MKSKLAIITLLSIILLFSGCSNDDQSFIEPGKYIMENNEVKDLPWVILDEDGSFVFNRGSATSYRPTGTYTVKSKTLILMVSDTEKYEFKIVNEKLIFQSGEFVEGLILKDAVFHLIME